LTAFNLVGFKVGDIDTVEDGSGSMAAALRESLTRSARFIQTPKCDTAAHCAAGVNELHDACDERLLRFARARISMSNKTAVLSALAGVLPQSTVAEAA
jgi:hypothetical protein